MSRPTKFMTLDCRNKAYRHYIRKHIKKIQRTLPEKAKVWKARIRDW